MSFQRLSETVEGKSRPPESRWKVVPQSRTGGRETPITEFVMCSWHKQLPNVIGVGPQWATTNVRQKATVVCEVRGSQSTLHSVSNVIDSIADACPVTVRLELSTLFAGKRLCNGRRQNVDIYIFFSNKIYGSNFIEQHSEIVAVRNS